MDLERDDDRAEGVISSSTTSSAGTIPQTDRFNPSKIEPAGTGTRYPVDTEVLADAGGTRLVDQGHPAFPKPERPRRPWGRWLVIGLIVAALLGVGLVWGGPKIREALVTVSTDDAFVSGHVTNVSARIADIVTEVRVDENDRVEPGTLLVRLDRVPFELAVRQAEAAVAEARSNVKQARAQVNGQLAMARASWFRRTNAQEELRRQVASLRAQVAALRARQSSLHLAEVDQARIATLVKRGSATQSELDARNNTLDVAREQVKQAWAVIQETRAALGLPPDTVDPLNVPPDLEQKQSSIQTAVSTIASSLAQIGIPFDMDKIKPDQAFEDILQLDSSAGLEKAFGELIEQAPAVETARASLVRAERQLDNARLQLSYTEIRSEIAGYVQNRSVHPGNRVEPGQTLLSVRPHHVWVDANFKETQLHEIRIGMPVDLHVDAYPGRVFKGRVAGFSPATGLSSSLLPPQNATGNYVKVTQRLPVRIELVQANPRDTPLFVGLSVVPHVRIKERPSGPGAGERLHSRDYPTRRDVGLGPTATRAENLKALERLGSP